jgi:eukaryotic-like serine/threonine-protein kinase
VENTKVGPFEILERLGSTRRQRVFRARQVEQRREYALKFINIPPNYDRELALEKLKVEFSLLRELRHPNLVRIFGAGVDGESIFIASELVEGESLASIISRRGRMAPDLVVEYARQLALCLEYLHGQDLIHSKITPEKILIDREGNLRLADLRLNRSKKRRWDITRQRDAELAAYLAPEQLTGFATAKSDIYSLGTIMYEMLVGKLPFPPENIARLTRRKLEDKIESVATQVLSCPVWLDRLVMQMVEPTPRKRPHSAHAVRLALEEIVRIDVTKRSAVDELSGAFNPLHINVDKSEARALLNKSQAERPSPFQNWKQWLALAGVAVVVSLLAGLLWMPSNQQNDIEAAEQMLASSDPQSWGQARQMLAELPRERLTTEQQQQVDEMLVRSKRQTLLDQARRGETSALFTDSVRAFIAAYIEEQQYEFRRAHNSFTDLLSETGNGALEVHVKMEAELGRRRTEKLRDLPSGPIEVLSWIKQSEAFSADQQEFLRQTLEHILANYDSGDQHSALIEAAKLRLRELDAVSRSTEAKAGNAKENLSDSSPILEGQTQETTETDSNEDSK